MPKVKSYTPAWLSAPNNGHKLFVPSEADLRTSTISPYTSRKRTEPGPRRTIARRGTEVFVANGKELKWGDLVYLKDAWELKNNPPIKREDSNGSFADPDEFAAEVARIRRCSSTRPPRPRCTKRSKNR